MKTLIALLMMIAPAFAQPPAAPPAGEEKPAEPAAANVATPAATNQPAPYGAAAAGEPWIIGDIDFGYRFRTGPAGSIETYRSIVNLNEGPRLFGIEFTIRDPKKRYFDSLNASGYNWGDPYNTAHVDAAKSRIYDFRFDYSNILYFNAVPSFANPFAPGGFNEQSFDVNRRMTSADLNLFPTSWIVPYLAFDRNTGRGSGISTFVNGATNSFPVPTRYHDTTNNYRGGVRFELENYHLTLEQGGTTYRNEDSAFNATPNFGNLTTPFLGQSIELNTLLQAYGISAHSIYSSGNLTASPLSWISLYGQFMYSNSQTDVTYQDAATGNLLLLSQLLFYNGQLETATGSANRPHVSANAGADLRPFRRFRIMEVWTTDRFHDAAFSSLLSIFMTPTSETTIPTELPAREVMNYNRNQTDLFFDVTSKLTLRGGYRYEWGDAQVTSSVLSQVGPLENGKLNRQVAIVGVNYRPLQKLVANADYEHASTTHAYFATSLYNYDRLLARARYQVMSSLWLQARFTVLNNQDPVPGVQYDFLSRNNAFSVNWTPNGGKLFSLLGEYDRATLRSNILILTLPFLTPGVSQYRDNAHLATAAANFNLPDNVKLTAGGSLAITNGTRPSRFYQPLAKLSVPLGRHVRWNTQWQWYGFSEQLFAFEGFRTHLIQTGLRISR